MVSIRSAVGLCSFAVAVSVGDEIPSNALNLLQTRADVVEQSGGSWNRTAGKCTSKWGEFGKGPLTRTQTVRQRNHGQKKLPPMDRDLFIDASANFAFCRIQKVGSTQWDIVLQKILKHDTKEGHGWTADTYEVIDTAHHKYGMKALEDVFRSQSATRAVFVRDPISRFASAYLDKCYCENCTQAQCLMRKDEDAGKPVSMRDAVDWALALGPDGYSKEVTNVHWVLQSEHCDLKNSIDQFTIVGHYDKRHVSEDAACVMKLAGLEKYNVPAKLDSGADTYWEESASRKSTARGGARLGYSEPDSSDEDSMLKKLFTREAAETLYKFLEQDYKTFNFPKPSWIAKATGEWYEERPDAQCKVKGDSSAFSATPSQATDDEEKSDATEAGETPSTKPVFVPPVWNSFVQDSDGQILSEEDDNDIEVLVGKAGYIKA